MNGRLTIVLLGLAATATIGAGCGSSSGSSASEAADGTSLSKAEYVKQATAICQKAREGSFERLAEYVEEHRSDGLPEAVLRKDAIKAADLRTIEGEIAALRALDAPAGDERQIESILNNLQAELGRAELEAQSRTPDQVENFFALSDKELRAYGIPRCTKTDRSR